MHSRRFGIITINYESMFSMAFLLWPVLNTYGFLIETVGLGDILILLVSVVCLAKKGINNQTGKKPLYPKYFAFTIFVSICSYFITQTGNSYGIALSLIRRIVYVIVFSAIAPRIVDQTKLINQYKKISMILAAVVFLQFFLHYVSGYSEPFIINSNLFPVRDVSGYTSYMNNWHIHLAYEQYKAPSLFTEASKYAHYVVPCMLLSLLTTHQRRNYLYELFISASLLATFSANAVVFMIVAWCCWFLFARENKNKYTKYLVGMIGIVALVSLLLGDNWFTIRINEIGNGMTSGSMRVLRGWIIYGMLPTFNKIFGVGIGNVSSYIELNGIRTGFDAGYLGYMSGLSEVAVASGIISLVFIVLVFLKYFLKGGSTGKSMSILLLVMLLSSAILETPTYGISILILEIALRNNSVKDEERI